MKAAYKDEAAYKDAGWDFLPKGASQPEKAPLRYYWQELAGCRACTNLYIPSEPKKHTDQYTYVLDSADESIDELRELYEFRNDKTVNYLKKHLLLSNLLKAAHSRIREYFGSDVHAVLDLVAGFEANNDERLFVFVQTALSPDEALDRLDELYERWWLNALSAVRPKLSIDIEYV